MPLRDGLPSPVIRTSSCRDTESDMRRWKKAQVTHLFLQIGTHVKWRNNRSVDCRNFHKIQVPLYYIFTCKPQAILCCYCIVSYFPPDFREVHPLGQLSPYGDSPFLCLGGLCTHLCVFQGNYSLGSHVEFLYNLSGSFYPFLAMTRANCFFSSVCKPKCAFVIQFWQRTRCLICFSLWVPVGIKLYFFFPLLVHLVFVLLFGSRLLSPLSPDG